MKQLKAMLPVQQRKLGMWLFLAFVVVAIIAPNLSRQWQSTSDFLSRVNTHTHMNHHNHHHQKNGSLYYRFQQRDSDQRLRSKHSSLSSPTTRLDAKAARKRRRNPQSTITLAKILSSSTGNTKNSNKSTIIAIASREMENAATHKNETLEEPLLPHHSTTTRESNEATSTTTTATVNRNNNISYHAVMHLPEHIARGGNRNRSFPIIIPVVVWPFMELGIGNAASKHMELNGIQESPLLQLSDDIHNFDPNVVWIGDTGYGFAWSVWCDKFQEVVAAAQARRIELGLPTTSWPIYIVDWTDGPTMQRCKNVEETVGREFVFYAQRSIVAKRKWSDKLGWVEEGNRIQMVRADSGIQYRHTPMIVRTDVIETLQSELRNRGLKLRDSIETLVDRPVDITHFWPLSPTGPESRVGSVQSKLRTKVSNIIFDMANTTMDLNVFVGTAGNTARQGRREVASDYVDALLQTKIVVVTQRDAWEDHYRLFEGLISGALVLTDRMISLPAGLKNGTSVIEFASEDQLRTLLEYYLKNPKERVAIAREGRRVSMSRHRSWHRIEEIIFGRALTVCSDRPLGDCPYIVHANETSR